MADVLLPFLLGTLAGIAIGRKWPRKRIAVEIMHPVSKLHLPKESPQ